MKDYYLARRDQLIQEFTRVLGELKKMKKHPEIQGFHAEEILRNFLIQELPKKYAISSGFVEGVYKSGKKVQSKQIDIVIYDHINNLTLKTISNIKKFPAEIVYGIISVKSKLTNSDLFSGKTNCLENISSFKELPRCNYLLRKLEEGIYEGMIVNDEQPTQYGFNPKGFVFAFDSTMSLDTIVKKLKQHKLDNFPEDRNYFNHYPDLICILNKGYIITKPKNIGLRITGHDPDADFDYSEGENSLLGFMLAMVNFLNNTLVGKVDLYKYV